MDRDGRHVLRGSGRIVDLEIALHSQNSNRAPRMRFPRGLLALSRTRFSSAIQATTPHYARREKED